MSGAGERAHDGRVYRPQPLQSHLRCRPVQVPLRSRKEEIVESSFQKRACGRGRRLHLLARQATSTSRCHHVFLLAVKYALLHITRVIAAVIWWLSVETVCVLVVVVSALPGRPVPAGGRGLRPKTADCEPA